MAQRPSKTHTTTMPSSHRRVAQELTQARGKACLTMRGTRHDEVATLKWYGKEQREELTKNEGNWT